MQKREFSSQSQRLIPPYALDHEISSDDSVNGSGDPMTPPQRKWHEGELLLCAAFGSGDEVTHPTRVEEEFPNTSVVATRCTNRGNPTRPLVVCLLQKKKRKKCYVRRGITFILVDDLPTFLCTKLV